MRLPIILVLLGLSALPSRAAKAASLPRGQAQEAHSEPAPQLLHLERVLMQKQDARDKGELPLDKYQEFAVQFRAELDAVMGRITPTPENKGLHAQILARLGEQEQDQALVGLDQALAQYPESPPLLVAKGGILYEKGDFQAADALALQAWEASGRKDERAWALHKMSEGRISGVRSGESASRLRPASDFARLDGSIPERHDINDTALDLIKRATATRIRGDMAATDMYMQAAMSADPTSKSMQDLYQYAKAKSAMHAETKAYLDQVVAAKNAGRHQEALIWMQKAYDRYPNDQAYEALQVARQGAADEAARSAALPANPPRGSSPALPLLFIFGTLGTGLLAYGGYQIARSQGTRTSDDGLDPVPRVSPEQARRNYVDSAVFIGTPIVIGALVFGGPPAWRAAAPVVTGALQQLRASAHGLATSKAGALLFPEKQAVARRSVEASRVIKDPASALQGAQLKEHLRLVAKHGRGAVRFLENGRIRYYDVTKLAKNVGEMAGRRVVQEWDPVAWTHRTWMEVIDHTGNVRIVRPETGGHKVHRMFDQAGNYAGDF